MFAVIGFVVAKLGVKLLKVGQYLIIILQLSTAQSTIRQRGSMRRSRSPARVQRPFFRPHTPLHRTEDDSSNDDLSSAGSSSGGRSSARARRTMRGRAARPDTILDTTVFAPLYGLEDDGAASPDDSRSSSSRGRSSARARRTMRGGLPAQTLFRTLLDSRRFMDLKMMGPPRQTPRCFMDMQELDF